MDKPIYTETDVRHLAALIFSIVDDELMYVPTERDVQGLRAQLRAVAGEIAMGKAKGLLEFYRTEVR
jgi:hypothetical protein